MRRIGTSMALICLVSSALPLRRIGDSSPLLVSATENRIAAFFPGKLLSFDSTTGEELCRQNLVETPSAIVATGNTLSWITGNVLYPAGVPVPEERSKARLIAFCGKPALADHTGIYTAELGVWVKANLGATQRELERSHLLWSPAGWPLLIRPYKGKLSMLTALDFQWKPLGSYCTPGPQYAGLKIQQQSREGLILSSTSQLKSPNLSWTPAGITVHTGTDSVILDFLNSGWEPVHTAPQPASLTMINGQPLSVDKQKLRIGDDTFMPWNGAKSVPSQVIPTRKLTWLVTQGGMFPMDLAGPDSFFGFGGFLRVGNSPETPSPAQTQLISELESWIGTPYLYGGNTREGIDCSGLVQQCYLKLGIKLPRTSALMRTTSTGIVVRDELKVGDVLTLSGHVAVYTGNGQTIETVKGGVGRSTIWSRTDVVVRRFLTDSK